MTMMEFSSFRSSEFKQKDKHGDRYLQTSIIVTVTEAQCDTVYDLLKIKMTASKVSEYTYSSTHMPPVRFVNAVGPMKETFQLSLLMSPVTTSLAPSRS